MFVTPGERTPMHGRAIRAVTALPFTAALVVNGLSAHTALARAWTDPALDSWAVALFIVLRAWVFGAFAVLLFVRRPAASPARAPLAFIACAGALAAVAVINPPSTGSPTTSWVVAGDLVALFGAIEMALAIAWLGRCFAVLPEARGLVTNGPYRLVRHPLYLGELTACFGLILANADGWNVAAGAMFGACQLCRMRLEEDALTRAYPDYAAYAAKTPRLLPLLPTLLRPGGAVRMAMSLRPAGSPGSATRPPGRR
jgi:protein-S-isoprenylcysteine O-methyltransferase Ste14